MMECMRSSVLFMGALLARCGEVHLTSPGGCKLGARPIDLHISAMKTLRPVLVYQAFTNTRER